MGDDGSGRLRRGVTDLGFGFHRAHWAAIGFCARTGEEVHLFHP
jgi:hypothetical protein